MGYQTLNFEVSAGVATITLNRPNNMNAMSPAMGAELHEVALAIDANQDIRAVILTGAGKVFCAGGDLGEFAAAGDGARTLIMKMTGDLHLALSRLARNAAPVIAAVNGTAAGAGFSLLMAADLAIAGLDGGLHPVTADFRVADHTPSYFTHGPVSSLKPCLWAALCPPVSGHGAAGSKCVG